MHVLVSVLGRVVVAVRVCVGDVIVLMCGVCVRVCCVAVLVFVRMRHAVRVLLCRHSSSPYVKYVVVEIDSPIRHPRRLPLVCFLRGDDGESRGRRARH